METVKSTWFAQSAIRSIRGSTRGQIPPPFAHIVVSTFVSVVDDLGTEDKDNFALYLRVGTMYMANLALLQHHADPSELNFLPRYIWNGKSGCRVIESQAAIGMASRNTHCPCQVLVQIGDDVIWGRLQPLFEADTGEWFGTGDQVVRRTGPPSRYLAGQIPSFSRSSILILTGLYGPHCSSRHQVTCFERVKLARSMAITKSSRFADIIRRHT